MEKIYNEIRKIGKALEADKIVLFGSRARGDNRERSDIDIAVYGLNYTKHSLFRSQIDDIATLLSFDIVFISEDTDKALLKNIEKDGILIMSKFTEKFDKLINAVSRLEEAINDYEKEKLTSIRDGVIQRFEFCTELSWKAVREYLIEEGYADINSPKSVMKTAFADGLLSDEQGWLDILNSRNITSHVYDEKTAAEVYNNIKTVYINLFKSLIEKLK